MEKLKRLREKRGLSQVKLAARADLNPATVNQIERGMRDASPGTLRKLAEALEVSLYELLEEETPKAPSRPSPEPYEVAEEGRLELFHRWKTAILEEGLAWEQEIEAVANGSLPLPGPRWASTLQLAAIGLMDELEEQGIHDALGPVLDAIDAGERVPEDLRQEATRLWNALVALLDVGNKAYSAARKARALREPPVERSEAVEKLEAGELAARRKRRKTEDAFGRKLQPVKEAVG